VGVQPSCLGHHLHAAAHPAAEAQERGPQPAGGSGAGPVSDVGRTGGGERVGQPGQGGVQDGHLLGGGALLRPEDRGGAGGAEQRVGDVAGRLDLQPGQPRVQPGEVDPGQARQALRGRGHGRAVGG